MNGKLKIALATDHRGVELKNEMVKYLNGLGHQATDLGTNSTDPCDYPDVAFPLAERVAKKEFDRGILVCMSGTGMTMCANKVRGIRAALCTNVEYAKLSREHNDANVLVIGSKFVSKETAFEIVKQWIETPFEGGRHVARVNKITEYENRKNR